MCICYDQNPVCCASQINGISFIKKVKYYNPFSDNSKQNTLTRLQGCEIYLLCGVDKKRGDGLIEFERKAAKREDIAGILFP